MHRQIGKHAILWVLLLVIAMTGIAQDASAPSEGTQRVLLIDETRTFASTLRVGALAGALRQSGMELEVRLETPSTSYTDPLADAAPPAEPFDLIVIVPIGIESGAVAEVWALYGRDLLLSPESAAAVARTSTLLGAVFEGVAAPVDVTGDLWIGCLASVYEMRGWL